MLDGLTVNNADWLSKLSDRMEMAVDWLSLIHSFHIAATLKFIFSNQARVKHYFAWPVNFHDAAIAMKL